MFWLIFVYPRSHSGWIGPIGEFNVSKSKEQQAYRYSLPSCPLTCLQYWGIGLRSSVKSYQSDSVTCFLYVLTDFCIPQVPFRLNWADCSNYSVYIYTITSLPVLHPYFLWLAFNMNKKACFPYALSHQSDRVTWFLYILTGFCIPQVPFRLNWVNLGFWMSWIYAPTSLPVLIPLPPDLHSILRHRLAFLSQIVPVR